MRSTARLGLFRLTATTACLALAAASPGPRAAAAGDETRVFVGDCITAADRGDPRVAGALDALVGTAISGGLGRLGGAWRAAGAARSRAAVAQLNLQIEPGERPACVQLVHGSFAACETVADAWLPPVLLDANGVVPGELRRAALAAGVCLTHEPALFVELELRASSDRTALALAPTALHYARTLDGRRGSRERALALQLVFHPPGSAPADHGATGAVVVFGMTALGSSTRFDAERPRTVRPHESAWFPTPFPPATTPDPRPDDTDATSGSGAAVPSTLTASLVETRDERPFLLFLADLLQSSTTELEAELQSLVLRDRRRELELEADRRRQLALVELESKRSTAILKRMEYCALPDDDGDAGARARLESSTELMRAEVETNLAADAAGRPRPFAQPIVPSTGPRRGC